MKRGNIKKLKKLDLRTLLTLSLLGVIISVVIIMTMIKFIKYPERYPLSDLIVFIVFTSSSILMLVLLIRIGYSDTVTKLPTTDAFMLHAVKIMFKKKLPLYASLFINVKNFRHINRIVGASCGDRVLTKYAKKLKKFLLPKEYIARLGGDNFIVLIYKHRLKEFVEFLKNIEVDVHNEGGPKDLKVYSRAGIYTLSDRDSISELFNCSSIALTFAKNSKSEDFVWFQRYMMEQTNDENELAYQFINAIQNNKFKVYYQPRINIETNQVCGGEALVRWERDGQLYMPETFLLTLERSGLIATLDFFVMEQVCKDLAAWKEKGLPVVPISSNFSKMNLRDKNFVHRIMTIISKYRIENSLFQVEITESFGEDIKYLKSVFEQLYVSGISTMIDRFGTGGFSWTLFKDPNITAIKLAKTVIDGIDANGGANDAALLTRNIIHACRDLKKNIICEGVESIAQRDMLLGMHCNEIQGFLYDKALTPEDFEKVLERKIYNEF